VTATDVASAQDVEVEVGAPGVVVVVVVVGGGTPETGVWFGGNAPLGAAEYVPAAELPEQTDGTVDAVDSPHENGTIPARRAAAVKNAAYDQVLIKYGSVLISRTRLGSSQN